MNVLVSSAAVAAATPAIAAVSPPESAPVAPHPDKDLLDLIEQYLAAEKHWLELIRAHSRIEQTIHNERRRKLPEALRWREQDAELGLPSLFNTKNHKPLWDRPIDVDRLRDDRWNLFSGLDTEYDTIISVRKGVTPSADARARADEIIAAYDNWSMETKPPPALKKIDRAIDKAWRAKGRILKHVAQTRATTIEGMSAKVRCTSLCRDKRNRIDMIDNEAGDMALSIFGDLELLAKGGLRVSSGVGQLADPTG